MAEHELGDVSLGTTIDLTGLDSGFDKAEKTTRSRIGPIGDVVKGALSTALGFGIADVASNAIGSAFSAIQGGMADAREANVIMAQTQAVITSTGGAAGVSAQHVADYAASLSAASGTSLFGDSQVQEASNLLLTFTNIKGTVLDASTAIAVDMAQALGGAPADSAIQLGKALNDPINGITALTRVGVTFTDEQKNQIATMQQAGDMAGAQGIILAELNKEFGGSAAAAAQADGGMAQLNDRWGELLETLGAMVLPVLGLLVGLLNEQIMPALEGFVAWLSSSSLAGTDLSGITTALSDVWSSTLLPAIQTVAAFFQTEIMPILSDLGTALIPVLQGVLTVLAGIWANVLVPALQLAWTIFTTLIVPVFGVVAGWLRDNLPGAARTLTSFLTGTVLPVFRSIADMLNTNVVPAAKSVADGFGKVVSKASEVATAVGEKLQGPLKAIGDALSGGLSTAINGVQTTLGKLAGWFDGIKRAAEGVVTWVGNIISALAKVVIPDALKGRSPPPFAKWLDYVAESAEGATWALSGMGASITAPSLSGLSLPSVAPSSPSGGWQGDLYISQLPGEDGQALAERVINVIEQRTGVRF